MSQQNQTIKVVSLSELMPDPNQPRQTFGVKALAQLQSSIADKGILNPITVEPKENGVYLIIDGERRYRCAKNLKMKAVPIAVLDNKLNEFERDIIRFQLQETHSQWSIFEKAEAMYRIKNNLGLSVPELSQHLAVSNSMCHTYLQLLELNSKMRIKLTDNKVPFYHVRELVLIQAATSDEIKKSFPHYMEKLIDSLQEGKISRDGLRKIRLMSKFGYDAQLRSFYQGKSSIKALYRQSGLEHADVEESIEGRAKNLTAEIENLVKSKRELNEIALAALSELDKKIRLVI